MRKLPINMEIGGLSVAFQRTMVGAGARRQHTRQAFGRLGTLSLSASEYSPRQITSRSTRRRSNRRRERRFMRLRSSTAVERQSSRSRRVRLQPVLSLFARPNLGEAARFAR
jgi:hypothetical protein